jgi:Ricin-type beta-trefoil lectin domain-like
VLIVPRQSRRYEVFRKPRVIALSAIVATMAALAPIGAASASPYQAAGPQPAPAKAPPVVTWRLPYGVGGYIGDYLQIYNAGRRNGNWVSLGRGNGSRNQKWYSIDTGVTYGRTAYAFKNLNSGLCMEASGRSYGSRVVQWACGRYPIQDRWWEYATAHRGDYFLQNVYGWTYNAGGYMCEGTGGRYGPAFVFLFSTVESGSCEWR